MNNKGLLNIVTEGLETGESFSALLKLKNELIENIRIESLKNSGTKVSDISIIKRITKQEKERPLFGKAHSFYNDGNLYFGFTEGHYVVASGNDFEYPKAEEAEKMDMGKLFVQNYNRCDEIKVDITDLKVFSSTEKRKCPNPYILLDKEGVKHTFNPFYLLDVLQFNDTNIIEVELENSYCPAFVKNEAKNTLGLLLPIRIK